jgi:hypothetical protein
MIWLTQVATAETSTASSDNWRMHSLMKKPRLARALFASFSGLATAAHIHAQPLDLPVDKPIPAESLHKVIAQFGKENGGWSFCVGGKTIVELQRVVLDEAKAQRIMIWNLTPRQVFVIMVSRLPCPVSPYREELRPATAADLQGMWVTPDGSQTLSQPHRVLAESKLSALRCEAVGFFGGGEARAIELRGNDPRAACTIGTAASMEADRAKAKTTTWGFDTPGRLTITRSDVADHEEWWETYVVETPFSFRGYEMAKGDVMSYLRKSPDAPPGVATRFRHLRKLAE